VTLQLSDIKTALRVDTTADDALLTTLMTAASDYIMGAVGTDDSMYSFYINNSRFDTLVMMFTDHWYKYRTVVTDASNKMQVVEIPYGAKAILLQLKGAYLWQLQQQANSTNVSPST
jgi:uncharacterized phage protein (predicted DNA packaging)